MIQKLFALFPLLVLVSRIHADFVVYGEAERDAWFADTGGAENVTTIGFSEFANGTTLTDHYAPLGVTFEGSNFVNGPFPTQYHDEWGLLIINGNDLYFDEPINWIAADFLGILRIEFFSGEEFLHSFQVPSDNHFIGAISTVPFDRVRIYDPTDFLTVLDDLHFGPIIAVPAPGILMPFALMLGFRRRRRVTT